MGGLGGEAPQEKVLGSEAPQITKKMIKKEIEWIRKITIQRILEKSINTYHIKKNYIEKVQHARQDSKHAYTTRVFV